MSAFKLKHSEINSSVDFKPFAKVAELSLQTQLEALKNWKEPLLFSVPDLNVSLPFFELTPKQLQKHIDLPPRNHNVIYIFSFINQFNEKKDFQKWLDELQIVKKLGREQGYTQVTGIRKSQAILDEMNINEITVYVGTSQDMPKRLREHIGHGGKGNATILLKHWPSLTGPNRLKLRLEMADFGERDISEALKLIEYHLSELKKPVIGNNRKA